MAPRGGTFNGDTGTIHVHFAVADLVEPCPSEENIG
jgi:hypothetical protein